MFLMRIGFFGKGGSGKTTLAAAYAQHTKTKKMTVLAIDADHNSHMAEILQINEPKNIGNNEEYLQKYYKGNRKDKIIVATTPPNEDSQFTRINPNDAIMKKFATRKENLYFMSVGSYAEEDKGATCYHGKLDALAFVMNHLLDTLTDRIIVDSTAGVDNYGSSLIAAYDINILIVEPTNKSIAVYQEFKELTQKLHAPLFVITNKIENEEDLKFIEKHIPEEKIIANFEKSNHLKKYEQGQTNKFQEFLDDHINQFENIEKKVKTIKKDWTKYMQTLKGIHYNGAKAWWDSFYNEDISGQAKTNFKYQTKLK